MENYPNISINITNPTPYEDYTLEEIFRVLDFIGDEIDCYNSRAYEFQYLDEIYTNLCKQLELRGELENYLMLRELKK